MIRAVFDANALVSGIAGFLLLTSAPGELLRRWRSGDFVLVVSPHILSEVERTFRKPYYRARFSVQQVQAAIELLRVQATVTPITVAISGVATHPEDDLVLATAVSAATDYLVTGDHKLQTLGAFGGVTILSPRRFLDLLQQA